MVKPTKAEIEQYEALKKKIDDYQKHRLKVIKDFETLTEGILKDLRTKEDFEFSCSLDTIATAITVNGPKFDTIVTIRIGGHI